jgi:hypothetical protein
MGMNHTRVIQCPHRCQLSNDADQECGHDGRDGAYRHRIVSNNPLIMKANATA